MNPENVSSHAVTYMSFKVLSDPNGAHIFAMGANTSNLSSAMPDINYRGVRIFKAVNFESSGDRLIAGFPSPRPFRLLRQLTRKGWRPKI